MTAKRRELSGWAADTSVLFLFAVILIWPLFSANFLDKWSSIESSFIAEVRVLSQHWPIPKWDPFYYLGTRFDYVYAMGLRLGPALLARAFDLAPAHAYHLYAAFFYALGISGAYVLGRVLVQSRLAGWITGLLFALTSPSFLVARDLRGDTQFYEPERLGVLIRYGEGPHSSSITCLVFALAFAWLAIQSGRYVWIVLAGLCAALVVWHNFYGATALAILYPILAWSLCVTSIDRRYWCRAAAVPAIAYGLLAFWLTPSYLLITQRNVKYIADAPNTWSQVAAVVLALLYGALTWRFARRRPERKLTCFLAGGFGAMFVEVWGYYHLHFVAFGNSHRHVPELDLIWILVLAAVIVWLQRSGQKRALIALAAVSLLVASKPVIRYVKHAHQLYVASDEKQRVEYQLQDWVRRNMPSARAHVTGSVRYWYLVWNDLQQIEGAQDPGILNESFIPAHWELVMGNDGVIARQWLQVLGADLVIVNDKSSQEIYHDQQHPEKFVGQMPVLYDNHRGDVIYQVPRRAASLVRIVDRGFLDHFPPITGNGTRESLQPYVDAFEGAHDGVEKSRWIGTDQFEFTADVKDHESALVQVSYDKSWHARERGEDLTIAKSALGFMRIDLPPGKHQVNLQFEKPLENQLGSVITTATLILLAGIPARRALAIRT